MTSSAPRIYPSIAPSALNGVQLALEEYFDGLSAKIIEEYLIGQRITIGSYWISNHWHRTHVKILPMTWISFDNVAYGSINCPMFLSYQQFLYLYSPSPY